MVKKTRNFEIFSPIESNQNDYMAFFRRIKNLNIPIEVHEYNHEINNSPRPKKYNFKKLKKATSDFFWTLSMWSHLSNSFYLEITNEYYILWEKRDIDDETIGSLYNIERDPEVPYEEDDAYLIIPQMYELKCLCKKSNISEKEATFWMLHDYWGGKLIDFWGGPNLPRPEEWGKDDGILSMQEIFEIFNLLDQNSELMN